MSQKKDNRQEPYLLVLSNRSILFDGIEEKTFEEGMPTDDATKRLNLIKQKFEKGFLINIIEECKQPDAKIGDLPEEQRELLNKLVDFTSEVGRALVGLTILQLCVKCITPNQSIRLHKAGRRDFSWKEGIPMRALDKNYITPVLKEYDLLRLNADGFMMTRSLAENYPYSKVYKAAIRGARSEWLEIVDLLEMGKMNPEDALRYIIILLLNRSSKFRELADKTIQKANDFISTNPSIEKITLLIKNYVSNCSYSARVFEVALHSLMQVIEEYGGLEGHLKKLTQMRSANKKHGNIGDIEVTIGFNSLSILEAWDAKYGKPYLRDELEELAEKLEVHQETEIAGFVVDDEPDLKDEIVNRMKEITELYGTEIHILTFDEWVKRQVGRVKGNISSDKVGQEWLIAFVESLCQKRRDKAPIDEPCDKWVEELYDTIQANLKN